MNYQCQTIVDNSCTQWVEVVNPFLPAMSAQEGRELGGHILVIFVVAYSMRLIKDLILNK